jgi:hypothetical protein
MNAPPPSQYDAAIAELVTIKPLDSSGKPSAAGKIGFISIGMSNTTMEFSVFKRLADADLAKSPSVSIVDGAQGGQTAKIWATQSSPWQVLAQRLQTAGVSPAQVQVAWIKQADAQPAGSFPAEAQELEGELAVIVQKLQQSYPNIRRAYLSSRIYAGYATTTLNPEPYAYEGAFSVRWLIQNQISGTPGLNYNAAVGPVTSPLLLWGPYLWAAGLTPRSDGLTWLPGDVTLTDGTHPSTSGCSKVADMLLDFFKNNGLAKTWFVK